MGTFDFVIVLRDWGRSPSMFYLLGFWDGQAHWTTDINQALRCRTPDYCEQLNETAGLGADGAERGFR